MNTNELMDYIASSRYMGFDNYKDMLISIKKEKE